MKLTPLVWLLAFSLIGCSYNPFITNNHTTGSPGATVVGAGAGAGAVALMGGSKPLIALGGIGGGMLGYYVTTLRFESGPILDAGGKVYTVGRFVGIYLPSDQLFEPNTADLLPQAQPILDSAADVLQRYPNNSIVVSGNTSGFAYPPWEQRLSQERAKKVSAYLWSKGLNEFKDPGIKLRRLTYVGYGNYFPISNSYTNKGIRENSRIQITSFPSSCMLLLDRRHLAMRNTGGMYNIDLDADSPYCCDSNCYNDDLPTQFPL